MNLIASLGNTPPAAVSAPAGKPNRRSRDHFWLSGYGGMRKVMRFMLWAQAQHDFPTAKAITQEFGCSKATAFRLIEALREAYGLAPLRERGDA